MSSKYSDFYLIINGQAGHYTVEAQAPGQLRPAPVPFVYEETVDLQAQLKDIQAGYSPSREAMQAIGSFLFKALMPPPILIAFGRAHNALPEATQLRLRLNVRPPELARLPWELLFNPYDESFLATRRSQPVVRFLDSSSQPVAPLEIEGALKVLYVTAQPLDLAPLNLAQSEKALRETLGQRAEITVLSNATPAKLRDSLRRGSFHILHYDGHGLFDDASHDQSGFLLLENDAGNAHPLSGAQLLNYLDGTTVRLVVLAACETAVDSTRQRFVGVAQRLMQASNLPAVVAMQFSIPDTSAIAFNRGFYSALVDGYPVDAALADGRMAILEVTGTDEPDWATPVLLMRAEDGQLWKKAPNQPRIEVPPSRSIEAENWKYDVYISYVDQEPDATWVWDKLLPRFEEAGLCVAVSGEVETPGVARVVGIERAMKACKRIIVVLSPISLADQMADFQNVLGQTIGIHDNTYRLLPVKVSPIDDAQIPLRLRMLGTINLIHPRRAARELNRLVSVLQEPLSQRLTT